MQFKKQLGLTLTTLFICFTLYAKDYTLTSPDGKNSVEVSVSKSISWSVSRNHQVLLQPGNISMLLAGDNTIGKDPVVLNTSLKTIDHIITAVVPVKNKYIRDYYNELRITMKGGYSLEFRAYNDGVAYRFITNLTSGSLTVTDENAAFNFNTDCKVWLPKADDPDLRGHYEGDFVPTNMKDITPQKYGYLPLYIANQLGTKMVLTESDLVDYPNMFLFGTGANNMVARFPKVPLELKPTGNVHLDDILVKNNDYIAKTTGNRSFPWRILIISDTDKGLLNSQLVYQLARPNKLKDTQWIKPGKAAWDWWSDNNVTGVDFKVGENISTYKYYVDFAADYGLQYVVLDEGWAKGPADILSPVPALDLPELIRYAATKNVGLILWTLWKPVDGNMDKVLDEYEKWGIKGVKIDFMASADQYIVGFYERVAQAAAKHHLLLDLHGAYKPVGLNRTYPNVLNYEGVKGAEQNKWSNIITPVHNTTIPFTRMIAGPMDYTPGAMLNVKEKDFQASWSTPMSMGTRAHQAAMYIVYDAPLQMLCDNPSNYKSDPAYINYIARLPTTWDKTISLEGKIGEYVITARQHGQVWYIGGMTNWDARSFQVPLNFLIKGKRYKIEILKDAVNANEPATAYQLITFGVSKEDTLTVNMASGGGYTAVITPVNF